MKPDLGSFAAKRLHVLISQHSASFLLAIKPVNTMFSGMVFL
jgi:hypothetical protein